MARPTIVLQKIFEVGLLYVGLFVDGRHACGGSLCCFSQARMIGLRSTLNGIDQRRCGRPKIQRCERSAIGRLQQRLIFGRSEQQFVLAVSVVVEQLDTRQLAVPE